MKPTIIVTSGDKDTTFNWQSDGWYMIHQRGTPQAEELFKKAKAAIGRGKDVPDAIRELKKAGFEVERTH